MFWPTIILLITCLEIYQGFAYQCPASISFSTMPGLTRVSIPVSNSLTHFKIKNEFIIDSNNRTRFVCAEVIPEIYALRNNTINYDSDLLVQTGGDHEGHIIAHALGGSNYSLNRFPINQNCKSGLFYRNVDKKLVELFTEHPRITYIAELKYNFNTTDTRPTHINAVYMDEKENILGSASLINSPPNTPCEKLDQDKPSKKIKRSLFTNFTKHENSTKPINCLDGCTKIDCWENFLDRNKKCRFHFHSVHANHLCIGHWCYCCKYY